MTYKQFKIHAVLIVALTIIGCLLVKQAKGEDVVPSTRAASYQTVFSVFGPPAAQNGALYPGTTMFMLYSYPKTIRETWHYAKTRARLTNGHGSDCVLEVELYTDGSMAYKIIK